MPPVVKLTRCPCMATTEVEERMCSKFFPTPFLYETIVDESGYPSYSQPNDGRYFIKDLPHGREGIRVSNQWIVPHNAWLLAKYQAHLNVKICATIVALRYLFKYVF